MESEERRDDIDLTEGGDASSTGAEDPLAGVPAEPIEDVSDGPEEERLGGEGAAIGEEAVQEPAPGEFMEEPEESEVEVEPVAEEPAAEEPEQTAEERAEAAQERRDAEPASKAPSGEPEKPESVSEAEPEKPKAKTPQREYKVLRIGEDDSITSPLSEPVKARNGDDAIKEAYKSLSDGEESMTLVAVPMGYWKPKPVKGREKKDYAVQVG